MKFANNNNNNNVLSIFYLHTSFNDRNPKFGMVNSSEFVSLEYAFCDSTWSQHSSIPEKYSWGRAEQQQAGSLMSMLLSSTSCLFGAYCVGATPWTPHDERPESSSSKSLHPVGQYMTPQWQRLRSFRYRFATQLDACVISARACPQILVLLNLR